jgi:hypothetical protein
MPQSSCTRSAAVVPIVAAASDGAPTRSRRCLRIASLGVAAGASMDTSRRRPVPVVTTVTVALMPPRPPIPSGPRADPSCADPSLRPASASVPFRGWAGGAVSPACGQRTNAPLEWSVVITCCDYSERLSDGLGHLAVRSPANASGSAVPDDGCLLAFLRWTARKGPVGRRMS